MANALSEFKDKLPTRVSVAKPISEWCVKDIMPTGCLEEISALICNPGLIDTSNLLKKAKRRLVFAHSIEDQKYVVKAFPLDTLAKKLKHKKYAYSEAHNMVQAERFSIPSPQLFGFGYQKQFTLINWNALLMEYLPYSSMEQSLNDNNDVQTRLSLLQKAYPLFNMLYKTGCNHIDFKPGSIHLDGDDMKIIDFQYVAYMNKPSLMVLAAQAGHFAWDVSVRNNWLAAENMEKWFSGLLEYLEEPGDDNIWKIFARTSSKRYSIKDRMNGVAGQS
jgi:tRNA A-37 threonylcarbamoyl transferase component Bud32